MPKTVHGKPVDEEKWANAKKFCAKKGKANDYKCIMGTYMKMEGMKGLEESLVPLDKGSESGYDEDVRSTHRLIVRKPKSFRCLGCGAMLFREMSKSDGGERPIEIKCRRCGRKQIC